MYRNRLFLLIAISYVALASIQCGDLIVPIFEEEKTDSVTANDYYPYSAFGNLYSWNGSKTITVYLPDDNLVSVNSYQASYRVKVVEAISRWNQVLSQQGISITLDGTATSSDIQVNWVEFFPQNQNILGFATFDTTLTPATQLSLSLTISGQRISDSAVFAIAVHEFGHALGIWSHSFSASDLMYPYITSVRNLSNRDIKTFENLYSHTPDVKMYNYSSTAVSGGAMGNYSLKCEAYENKNFILK